MEVNLESAEFALRESLRKENSPLKNLGKVHDTVKWQKKIFYNFWFNITKGKSGPKIFGSKLAFGNIKPKVIK